MTKELQWFRGYTTR